MEAGKDVQVLQRRGRHFDRLRTRGLVLQEYGGDRKTFRPSLSDAADRLAPAELVVVTVKAYDTPSVAVKVPSLVTEGGWVVSMQNGLGNAEVLSGEVEETQIALGPCTYGAFLDEEGVVHAAGQGDLRLGPYVPGRSLLPLEKLFLEAGFRVSLVEDPRPSLWEKLVINAGINPLTALARCRNGDILRSPDLGRLMRQLVGETVAVSQAEGIPLDEEISWQRCLSVCRQTADNRSSMLQDVEAGRRTENEAISGQVVALGKKHAIPVPLTENLWALIRGIDSFYGA
jgi:2-dehydropantoate 2-reductase